jgi:hypothetical protein
MSATDKTANEVFESLNGFDEIAIKVQFGQTVNELAGPAEAVTFLRALIFTEHRRAGMKDHPAWEAAMNMRVGDVRDYFADDDEDRIPDQPVTDSGKGDSQPESEPTT